MRWFLGLLLVANVVVFMWGYFHEGPLTELSAVPTDPAPDLDRLRIVTESPAALYDERTFSVSQQPAETIFEPEPPAELHAVEGETAAVADDMAEEASAINDAIEDVIAAATPALATGETADTASSQDPGRDKPRQDEQLEPVVQAAPVPPEPEMADAPPEACVRLGPFDSAEAAKSYSDNLPAALRLLQQVTQDSEKVIGYYVLIPPAENRAAAEQTLEALTAKGITDTWLFRGGPMKNGISLGLFGRESNAETLREKVKQNGFESEVRERTKSVRGFYLEIQGSDDALRALKPPTKQQSTEQMACPA